MSEPGAPIHMVMSSGAQWLFTVLHFTIAVAITVWLWRRWDREEARVAVLILIGGGLSVLAEAFFDRLGFIWHAAVGQWTLLKMFGHSVPLWMLPVYYWFIGGQTVYVLQLLRRGATTRDMWRLYAFFCAMDAALELPILYAGGVYTYFGHQPFWSADAFPLPGWYIVLNGILPLAAAAAVLMLGSLRDRRYAYAIPVVIPMFIFAVYTSFAWPVWAALNAHVTGVVTYAAGAVTIVLALFVCHLLVAVSVRAAAGVGVGAFWPPSGVDLGDLRSSLRTPRERARSPAVGNHL